MKHILFAFCLLFGCLSVFPQAVPAKGAEANPDHMDALTGPFPDGLSVTASCLECHEDQGKEMLGSAHWQWKGPTPYVAGHENDTHLGKINLINNF